MRPGAVIVVAGPDGVGKTTLCDLLARALDADVLRLHTGPWILPRRTRAAGPVTDPHGTPPYGRVQSALKLLYLLLDLRMGWALRVQPRVRRGAVVLLERGGLDAFVDPVRYRVGLSERLLDAYARLVPTPDLGLVVDDEPAAVHARKPELPRAEILRQLEVWRRIAARDPSRWAVVSGSPDERLAGALARLRPLLEARAALALAQRCLGAPGPGTTFTAVGRAGRIRWLLPAGPGTRGPRAAGLYRPLGPRHGVAAIALDALQLAGASGRRVRLDPAGGLAPVLAHALGRPRVELAAALPRDSRSERLVLAVRADGRLLAYAKVGRGIDAARLAQEQAALESLAGRLRAARLPAPLRSLEWEGCFVLLLEPVPSRGRADRALGGRELAALAELAGLPAPAGFVRVHGDFAPWNCAPDGDRLALWDWEASGIGLPLEDLFHWRAQRTCVLGRGTVAALVGGALHPDEDVLELCAATGAEPGAAPAALAAALERGLRAAGHASTAGRTRAEALQLLSEAA